jgi:hypothetical protein
VENPGDAPEHTFLHESRIMDGGFTPDGASVVTLTGSGEVASGALATGVKTIVGRVPGAIEVAIGDGVIAASGAGSCVLLGAEPRAIAGCHGRGVFAGGVLHASLGGARAAWDVATLRPRWRATVALSDPPRVLTHRGWSVDPGERPWRGAAEHADRGVGRGDRLCLVTGGRLTAWDGERERFSVNVNSVDRLFLDGDSCLVLARGELRRHPGGALVATWDDRRSSVSGDVVGYADGFIHVGRATLADTPSAEVTALAAGPASTMVAGFGDGMVGVWGRGTLQKLHEVRLHGPIEHLLPDGDRVIAVSALGETATLDLSVLDGDYCGVMREIWAKTPVVWSETGAIARPAPAAHRCVTAR